MNEFSGLNAEFLTLAPAVYGRYWKTDICRHLGYTSRTVWNWMEGKNPPPVSLIILLVLYRDLGFTYVRKENDVRKVRKNATA